MKNPYSLTVRGKHKTWSHLIWAKPEHVTDWLEKLMHDGVPVYYIHCHKVLTSSIQSVTATVKGTYITLHDGATINTANFGRVAFWSRSEAEKARAVYDY